MRRLQGLRARREAHAAVRGAHECRRRLPLGRGRGEHRERPHVRLHMRHPGSGAAGGARSHPQVQERRHCGAHGHGRQCEHGALHSARLRHHRRQRRLPRPRGQAVQRAHTRRARQRVPGEGRSDMAALARARALLAPGQVRAGEEHHQLEAQPEPRGGRRHRRRHQRRTGAQEGRRRLRHGHTGHRRGQGGLGHHTHRRQLQLDRQGGHVGPQRLRLHRQVPPVSAHRQRGRRHLRLLWRLHRRRTFAILINDCKRLMIR